MINVLKEKTFKMFVKIYFHYDNHDYKLQHDNWVEFIRHDPYAGAKFYVKRSQTTYLFFRFDFQFSNAELITFFYICTYIYIFTVNKVQRPGVIYTPISIE